MSLSAWEQQTLNSIKNGLAGSDPELATLLSVFTRLASGEDMPERETIRAGSRPALRRLGRARWRSNVRRLCQRIGVQRAALLLWLLATAALMALALALTAGGDHGTCTESVSYFCVDPAPGHSSGSRSHNTTTGRAPDQPAARTQQANPRVPPG